MPSLSVYVSKPLASVLRELGVPASAVCQRALEQEVRMREAFHRVVDKGAVEEGARRLREARGPDDEDAETDGYESGLDWALHAAEEPELRALAELTEQTWVGVRVTAEEWPTLFGELAHLAGRPHRGELVWGREPFIVGFVRGAVDAYWAMLAA